MLNLQVQTLFDTVKEIEQDGVTFLVVKGVPLIEGVLNSHYVAADEFGSFVQDWNGVPVVVRHPTKHDGSARYPDTDVPVVGRFYNAKLDGTRLVGEFWIEKDKLETNPDGTALLTKITNGHQMEVSTGYYAESVPEAGEWNTKPYTFVAKNLHPDHIALLPDEVGACSLKDGCGLNRNSGISNSCETSHPTIVHLTAHEDESLDARLTRIRESFSALMRKPRADKFADQPPEYIDAWVREVFDEYIIVEMSGQLYKVTYIDSGTYVTFADQGTWQPVHVGYIENIQGKKAPKALVKMWDGVYRSALASAHKGKGEPTEEEKGRAAAVAWGAVKKKYKKDKDGKWVLKKNVQNISPELGLLAAMAFVAD